MTTAAKAKIQITSTTPEQSGGSARKADNAGFDLFLIFSRYFMPFPFLAAALAGFLLCTFVGFQTTKIELFRNFQRFYPCISPESIFYPTVSQMRQLVKSKARTDQTLVIVGGNSIFNGLSQPVDQLWTRRLQEILGPHYAVINLSFRGTMPFEAGYVVFESLRNDYKKILYVTICAPGACGQPESPSPYQYIFRDALNRGILSDDGSRKATISVAQSRLTAKQREDAAELDLRTRLDSKMYFEDLWNTVGYRYFFTVWNSLTWDHFTLARKQYPDAEPGSPPVAQRFKNVDIEMEIVRGFSSLFFEKDRDGAWRPAEAQWKNLQHQVDTVIPSPFRQRSIVVFPQNCPFYVNRLTPSERERDNLMRVQACKLWKSAGYHPVLAGEGFTLEDYNDRAHLSTSGGAKLAQQLAPGIEKVCKEEGF